MKTGHNKAPKDITSKFDKSYAEVKAMFSESKEIRLSGGSSDPEFVVRVPYDKEMVENLREMKGRFNPTKKEWRLRVHHYERLTELAPRIAELAGSAWFDHLNAGSRIEADDKRISIPEADLEDFRQDEMVFVDGDEWIVSHIGRPQQVGEDIRYSVFLKLPKGVKDETSDSFSR